MRENDLAVVEAYLLLPGIPWRIISIKAMVYKSPFVHAPFEHPYHFI